MGPEVNYDRTVAGNGKLREALFDYLKAQSPDDEYLKYVMDQKGETLRLSLQRTARAVSELVSIFSRHFGLTDAEVRAMVNNEINFVETKP